MSDPNINVQALQAFRLNNERLRQELKNLFITELKKHQDSGRARAIGSEEYIELLITCLPLLTRLMESLGNTVFLEVQSEAIDAITTHRHH